MLFWKLYLLFGKQDPTKQEIYFSFKMFKVRFLRSLNCSNTIWSSPWHPDESGTDISTTLIIFLCCHYYYSLLCCNYCRSIMLRNSTSWSHLDSTLQKQLALNQCESFFINDLNMIANKVEKHCFAVSNVKLQVKIRFKTFY